MRKKKSKLKYSPLGEATPGEFQEAMQKGSYWLADALDGHTESGAFSEAFLGEEPRLYFTKKAYKTLKSPDCKWKWKEGIYPFLPALGWKFWGRCISLTTCEKNGNVVREIENPGNSGGN